MWRALIILLLLLGTHAEAARVPLRYTLGGTSGTITLRAGGWLDSERIWFVANAQGAENLPYSAAPCPAAGPGEPPRCALWGVIDVAQEALLSLHAQPDFVVSKVLQLDGRLYMAGMATRADLPQLAESALSSATPGNGYLLVAPAVSAAEFGSYLPAEFAIQALLGVDDDLVLAGSAPCNPCLPGTAVSGQIRLLRASNALTALRYDRVLPGHWSIHRGVIEHRQHLHFATIGDGLPTTAQAALPQLPARTLGEANSGGVLGVDANLGELIYATYLGVPVAVDIVWDAARDGVWLLSSTSNAQLPLTADAADTTFCEPGSCDRTNCVLLGGQVCHYPRELVLQRLDSHGQRIAYASFIGGPASDNARVLKLDLDGRLRALSAASRIGQSMAGLDAGPRELTVVDPEARSAWPSVRTPEAQWTADTFRLEQDPAFGDLFGSNVSSTPRPGLPVVHLAEHCQNASSVYQRCFTITLLNHLGGDPEPPRTIPGPGAVTLLLLSALVGTAAWFRRARERRATERALR